jgi:hypothetical protein
MHSSKGCRGGWHIQPGIRYRLEPEMEEVLREFGIT